MSKPLRVLSLNIGMMGHIAYQKNLETGFATYAPEVQFRSLLLLPYPQKDWIGYLAGKLLARPIPGMKNDRDYLRFRSELGMSIQGRRMLEREMAVFRPDVVHVHTQSIALTASPLFAKVPTVIGHDYTTALSARDHGRERTYAPSIAREQQCFRSAAAVLSWSEFAQRSVIEDYGVASEKTTVIPPFIAAEKLIAAGRDRTPAPPGAKRHLLFVGNDFERKGGNELLEAFARENLAERCILHIVSNNAPSISLPAGVELHRGLQSTDHRLFDLYRQADLFVLPTREESFGVAFVEAIAAGLPCIGTNVMAVPEIVRDGINGVTIPPRDVPPLAAALRLLVERDDLRARYSEGSRRLFAERFDPAENTRRIVELFRRVA